jgi:hypothetical protein
MVVGMCKARVSLYVSQRFDSSTCSDPNLTLVESPITARDAVLLSKHPHVSVAT